MNPAPTPSVLFFIPFEAPISLGYPTNGLALFQSGGDLHPLGKLAAKDLQLYLHSQQEWTHNFGLNTDPSPIIGKMFGVLVVETPTKELGYLAAFSGKLAGSNQHRKFVPPVFDLLAPSGFLNEGMKKLDHFNQQLQEMEAQKAAPSSIALLKSQRKKHSHALQHKIFEQYHFLNQAGEEKSLNELFKAAGYKKPPAGAGECAGPKLLQYAFQHQLKPLALVEFWWGQSPKSATWKHGHFYACCKEKCAPILAHMLSKTIIDKPTHSI